MYRVTIGNRRPVADEGQGMGWFTAMEMLNHLALAPGNKAALTAILKQF